MALEKEFLAMRQIDRAFSSLQTEDRERVIKWANDKYGFKDITVPHNEIQNVAASR